MALRCPTDWPGPMPNPDPFEEALFRNWDTDRADWPEEDRRQAEIDDRRPRVDMTTWTPAHEAALMKKMEEAAAYLRANGQDISTYELRRYWAVGNAYAPDERNNKIPEKWNFTVHEIFMRIPDRQVRQQLLHSRDDWTVPEAKEAVRALDKITPPDSQHRARFS